MIVIKVVSELGITRDIQVAPNDFIAHVKSLCQGKHLTVAYKLYGISTEMRFGACCTFGAFWNTLEQDIC